MTKRQLCELMLGRCGARSKFLDEASENADHDQWQFINMALPLEAVEASYWQTQLDNIGDEG